MPKCLTKILHIRLTKLLFIILWVYAIISFFTFYGKYNYPSIKRDELKTILHKALNTNLLLTTSLVECKYDFIKSINSINAWEVPKKYDNFSAVEITDGSYYPKNCKPLFSVAILVTYRNRQSQLDIFIPYIHNFLRKQNIHYKIYLIEQRDNKPWNKGALYNIGARQAIADKFPCLILQDVDLLPLDEANLYACLQEPRHMSASIDKFRFVLPYNTLVGGVTAIQSEHYVQVNGFSNRFKGWGGEDDDFAGRLYKQSLNILRLPQSMSRYTMLLHRQEEKNINRHNIISENRLHYQEDGYNSVKYDYLQIKQTRLFTMIGVRF